VQGYTCCIRPNCKINSCITSCSTNRHLLRGNEGNKYHNQHGTLQPLLLLSTQARMPAGVLCAG
jgi:hypothetical protein